MGDKSIRLLLVEDDEIDQMAFKRFIRDEKRTYDYSIAGSLAESEKLIAANNFDLVISDYMLGDGTLFDLLDLLEGIPVIVTTGAGNEDIAVKAMKSGACDYLVKDTEGRYLRALPITVERAVKRKEAENEIANYRENLELLVKERTAALETEIVERKRADETLRKSEERLSRINTCFLNFTSDTSDNINQLTSLCGELLGAACALYNRVDQGLLYSWGQWNTPAGYNPVDKPDGHICFDVVKRASDEVLVVSNLQETDYARTDPHVVPLSLQTYMGKAVKFSDKAIGSLCVVYQDDFVPSEADKKFMGIIAAAIGVEDERRRTEVALRESEAQYRSMMEAMVDATYICSSDFRVEYMNPAMIKSIGRDATGEACHLVMHGLEQKCSWCVHDKVMNGDFINYEVVSPRDGKTYHISNSPIRHTTGSVSKLTVFHDVSEIKQLEANIQQAQKMEAIGTLAGGIAHDFNNILFPMLGFSEMLREDLPADSPLQGHVDEILRAALRSKDLVKQILAFSRQSDPEITPVKIQPIIKEALKLLRSSLPTTIDIQQDIDTGCGVVVADPTQIHQIIMNLVTNAYHAMENTGGELKVHLQQVRMESDKSLFPGLLPGEYAHLTVADNGVGIEKDVAGKIFEPYFTKKEMGKGTGLGLSVVQGIIKSCNGDIHILSEPGKGTDVHVYLPVIATRADGKPKGRGEPVQGGHEKILLVDDEEAIVRMEQEMLKRLGYQVTARTGSGDALGAFKASPDSFDLVITDMTMPHMTGIELAGELRKIRPDIPVVLFTGFSDRINEERSKALGIQGYVTKPVIKREIAEAVRKVLNNSRERVKD